MLCGGQGSVLGEELALEPLPDVFRIGHHEHLPRGIALLRHLVLSDRSGDYQWPSNVSTAHGTRHAERSKRGLTWGGVGGGVEEVAGASEEVRNVALAVALRVGPWHAAAAHAQLHAEREAAAVHALGVGGDDRPNRRHGPEQEVDEAPVELGGPLLQLLGEFCF
jgi:hypothetical protein